MDRPSQMTCRRFLAIWGEAAPLPAAKKRLLQEQVPIIIFYFTHFHPLPSPLQVVGAWQLVVKPTEDKNQAQEDAEQLEGKLLHAKSQAKLVKDDSLDSSGSLYFPSPPAPLAAYRPKKPFEQELEEKIRSPPRTVPQAGEGTCNTQQHVVAQVFVVIVVAVVDSLFCALVLALQCVQQSYSIVHFGTKVAL